MKVAIIGHGSSLLKAGKGQEIDSHDAVVRIKRCWELLERPAIYGTRTDHVVGSYIIAADLINQWGARGVKSFWLFEDTRTEGLTPPGGEGVVSDPALCKQWRDTYREIRQPLSLDPLQATCGALSDDRGHKHPSAGLHAIMFAMALLKPSLITLYGFDSIASGRFSWSVTRGPDWAKYPDHNWPAECELLDVMAEHYGYTVTRRHGSMSVQILLDMKRAA